MAETLFDFGSAVARYQPRTKYGDGYLTFLTPEEIETANDQTSHVIPAKSLTIYMPKDRLQQFGEWLMARALADALEASK